MRDRSSESTSIRASVYTVPVKGCNRGSKLKGLSLCEVKVRVNSEADIRLHGGAIRRDRAYDRRPSVERVFSRWKQRDVLESHSFRGLRA